MAAPKRVRQRPPLVTFEQRFNRFFDAFNAELRTVHETCDDDGIIEPHSSWDRRAAYLLWKARGCP